MELTFTPITDGLRMEKKIHLTKQMMEEIMQEENLRSLTGLLHTEISVAEIRAEWLEKHDHTN